MSTSDFKFMKRLAQDDVYNINIYKLFNMDDSMLSSILNLMSNQQDAQKHIRRQYKKLVKLYHPDKNPPHIHTECKDILHMLKNAYAVMTDNDLLYKYNKLYMLAKKERQHNELKSNHTIYERHSNCDTEISDAGVPSRVASLKHNNTPLCNSSPPRRSKTLEKTYQELNKETNTEIQEILSNHSRFQNMEKNIKNNSINSLVGDELQTRLESDKVKNFVQHIHQGDKQFNRIFAHINKETTAIIPIQHIKSCNDSKYTKYAAVNQKDYKLINSTTKPSTSINTIDTQDIDDMGDIDDIGDAAKLSAVDKFNNCDIHEKLVTFTSLQSNSIRPFKPKQNNKTAILHYKQATQNLSNLNINEFTQEQFSSNI